MFSESYVEIRARWRKWQNYWQDMRVLFDYNLCKRRYISSRKSHQEANSRVSFPAFYLPLFLWQSLLSFRLRSILRSSSCSFQPLCTPKTTACRYNLVYLKKRMWEEVESLAKRVCSCFRLEREKRGREKDSQTEKEKQRKRWLRESKTESHSFPFPLLSSLLLLS